MKRIIQPDLMRGHRAQRAAMLLLMGLIAVLCASVYHGLHGLSS
jgi:hypothetical protein